jgi:hypothetical protein
MAQDAAGAVHPNGLSKAKPTISAGHNPSVQPKAGATASAISSSGQVAVRGPATGRVRADCDRQRPVHPRVAHPCSVPCRSHRWLLLSSGGAIYARHRCRASHVAGFYPARRRDIAGPTSERRGGSAPARLQVKAAQAAANDNARSSSPAFICASAPRLIRPMARKANSSAA